VDQERRCPRCETAVPAGKFVCLRCEQRIDRPIGTGVRYNPAGLALPSPIQGHATVLVGVVAAILVLGYFAFTSLQGVGPFTAIVVGGRASEQTGTTVQLSVTNGGTRAGAARCQVTGRASDGRFTTSPVLTTTRIEPKGHASLELPVTSTGAARLVTVSCS
jgi:hypothetical protein